MKTVAVVGAGAIGTFLGTYLARTGADVSALARGATAAALRAHGFRFEEGGAAPHRAGARDGGDDRARPAGSGRARGEGAVAAGPRRPRSAAARPAHRGAPAMNGVPWWFFHGLGGPHEGAAVRAVDPDGRHRGRASRRVT